MLFCTLCTKLSANSINLITTEGERSYEYGITTNYFTPKLLNSYNSLNPKTSPMTICEECWGHISEFYDFQQMVHSSHNKLQARKDCIASLVKDTDTQLPGTEAKEYSISSDSTKKALLSLKGRRSKKSSLSVSLPQNGCPDGNIHCHTGNELASAKESGDSCNAERQHDDSPFIYDSEDNSVENAADKAEKSKDKNECDDFISKWKRHLDCYICGRIYSNLAKLRQHFRQIHPQQKCYIICCHRKLCFRFQIIEHIRLHIDPNAFQCDICGQCTSDSRGLRQHKRNRHTQEGQEKRFECSICQKRFAKKGVLKNHMDTHATGSKDHICKDCGKGFVLPSRLKMHERSVHDADRICDQCGKTIHGKYALKQHLLEHDGIKKRKWPCDQCEAQLNSHSSLKRHREAKHQQGNMVYSCIQCGKVAPSKQALSSHIKYVHKAVRKYKCNICDKAFKVAIVLREHMAIHTGEDMYKCPHCPKTFKANSNMHHHRKKAHPVEWQQARSKNKSIDSN